MQSFKIEPMKNKANLSNLDGSQGNYTAKQRQSNKKALKQLRKLERRNKRALCEF